MEEEELERDDGMHEDELVLVMLRGGDVEEFLPGGWLLLEVFCKVEDGGIVVQQRDGDGLPHEEDVREKDRCKCSAKQDEQAKRPG